MHQSTREDDMLVIEHCYGQAIESVAERAQLADTLAEGGIILAGQLAIAGESIGPRVRPVKTPRRWWSTALLHERGVFNYAPFAPH